MSRAKETFGDAELNSIAMEIIHDLSTKPLIDPNDAFICQLAEEIEMEILDNIRASSASYTDPSLYLPLSNHSSTATHPEEASPTILSQWEMSENDSFARSFPSIPPSSKPNKSISVPYKLKPNKKRAGYATKNSKTRSISPNLGGISPFLPHSPRYTPYHPPVSINLSLAHATTVTSEGQTSPQSLFSSASDISSCLSPRDQTPKSRVSAIPDFCEEYEDVVTIRIPRTKKKKSNRKMGKDVRKSKNKKKRSMTPTPSKRNRVEWKGKTNSNVLTRNEMEQYNEYAVEMEDGFIFFQPYSNMRKKVNV
eukprot:524813_1